MTDERIEGVLIAREWRHSRMVRDCFRCGNVIEVGELYVHEFGLIDGEPWAMNMHTGWCLDYED